MPRAAAHVLGRGDNGTWHTLRAQSNTGEPGRRHSRHTRPRRKDTFTRYGVTLPFRLGRFAFEQHRAPEGDDHAEQVASIR